MRNSALPTPLLPAEPSAQPAPGHDVEVLDVLIVGAGISGIDAAAHLQLLCPRHRFAIFESRASLGGTWDLFRYPGIRSDSDMHTLGFAFKPWVGERSIADGPSILQYLRDTVRERGLEQHIRLRHSVRQAAWSTQDSLWTVQAECGDAAQPLTLRCRFLFMCTGYYDYAAGYAPEFPGLADFPGRVVHPQQWPADIDVAGKQVVIIGSGATAVTLAPELARTAAQVTLLQRSPTYMLARPSRDEVAAWMAARLPAPLAAGLARWKNLLLALAFFRLCRRRPERAKGMLLAGVRHALGPGHDIGRHFTPHYKPWQQRLCLVPDGDLFKAVRAGRIEMVTDHVQTFTRQGIRLRSGRELPADLVVTATGLQLKMLSGVKLLVDGEPVEPAALLVYKGVMFRDLPNFALTFGYTNASWTLKADLTSTYVCRLLNHMAGIGARRCTPRADAAAMPLAPWVDFSSGYFQRALHELPQQGVRKPWKLNQNYLADLFTLRFGRIDDGRLEFA